METSWLEREPDSCPNILTTEGGKDKEVTSGSRDSWKELGARDAEELGVCLSVGGRPSSCGGADFIRMDGQ